MRHETESPWGVPPPPRPDADPNELRPNGPFIDPNPTEPDLEVAPEESDPGPESPRRLRPWRAQPRLMPPTRA